MRQETRSTGETVLVYEKKTFDNQNQNTKSGKFEYRGHRVRPET